MAATMSLIGTAPMDILAQFLSEGGILTNLGKSFGMSDTNTQYFVMAVTLTITIITVIATMILKPDKAATKTMEAAANFGNKASKAVESVGNSMKIFDSIGRSIVSALNKAKDLEKLEKIIEPMITSIEKATKVVTQALDRLIQFVQKTVEKSRLIRNIMEKISSEINRNFANGRGLMWIGVLQGLMGAYNGFTSAASSFIQADLVRTKARLDAQMAEIEAMMRVLKKTIQSIIDGLGDMGELRKELNMLHDSMLSNMSQLTKQLTSH
jgi:prefoldin subunit 5